MGFDSYRKAIEKDDLKETRALVFSYNIEKSKSKKMMILKMINQELEQARKDLLKVA